MAVIQTIGFPAIVGFSFATVTPMFWYGPVLIRFATGILMVMPGSIAFYAVANHLDRSTGDIWLAFASVMFTQFVVAGAVALVIQMWSPWTLIHRRGDHSPLPQLGTRAILELTGVAAIGCAMFMGVEVGSNLEGNLFFAGMGLLSSFAVIAVLIAFLRDFRRNLISALVAFAASFAMAGMMCGFLAISEFGYDSITRYFASFVMATTYGAVVIAGVMWLCVNWLRICGWRCVNRNLEQR
jgi:hypothetical protein